MTKKHKRSPYEDLAEASGPMAKAPKLPRDSHARKKPSNHGGHIVTQNAGSNNFNALSGGSSTLMSSESTPPVAQRMSIEMLEQKKMLLPYLDKIEYINVQLRQRGLLPDDTGQQPTQYTAPLPLPAPTSKSAQSSSHKSPQKPSGKPLGSVKMTSSNQEASSSTAKGTPQVTRQRSEGQLQFAAKEAPPVKRAKITGDADSVAVDTLRRRYPRLFGSIEPARLPGLTPRVRPINWLLRLIEEIYDELTTTFILGANLASTPLKTPSPRPEDMDFSGLGNGPLRPRKPCQPRLVMPFQVRKQIDTTLGLVHLADQECLDLMLNMEATLESFPQVALFALFVREIYDDDTLLFFLFIRHIIQREFDLHLRAKSKLAHSSTTGKKFLAGDLVHLVAHPLVPDGSKAVLLSQAACELTWRRVFSYAIEMGFRNSTGASPFVLAQYMAQDKMAPLFLANEEAAIEHVLVWSVDAFRNIAEDIIAQYKYQDDGESLRGLLRLRDTISSDAKIEKLMTTYSGRERTLRNWKVDLLRLERSNTEDNCNRTHLRLLRNQIGILEQELEHIQAQISMTENLVNDVWKDVVSTSPTKASKAERVVQGEFSRGAKELPSVLARFAAHISRLQRKHEIEVQAAAKLAKPWKKQMEELQLRMVIKIQRAYRARRRAHEVKRQAREELHEKIRQREVQKQREFMDRKRQEALHDKDLQRHQNRMLAKRQQEEATREALQKKQEELLERVRNEQITLRDKERNEKRQKRMFTKWCDFVSTRKKKRNAGRLFLKFQFMKWRHHYSEYKRRDRSAALIQRVYRRRQEKRKLRKVVQMNKKRAIVAKRYVQKIQARQLQRVFNKWGEYAAERIRLRTNFQAILQRRVLDWFHRWTAFIQEWKQRRLEAVLLVQRVYRGRLARQVFKTRRLRNDSVQLIQRMYRGYRGRLTANARRQTKARQDAGCREIRLRICQRVTLVCLDALHLHAERERHIKRMAERRRDLLLRSVMIDGLADYRDYRKQKRAELLQRRHASATVIQRNFRRHHCQLVFRESIIRHRAAIRIQRVYRGYRGRQRVRKYRWEIAAARKLQTIWRQRQARRLAEKTRAEMILLGAYKGDFTATQRAIKMGYWYVADGEGNGILHLAAAAGHKRIVKLCLRHQMDINAVNKHLQTPIHLILANLPSLVFPDEDTQRANDDRVALAAYMIDHGAWHEAPDEHGLTPLLLCSALGQTPATEMLLERSANTDARAVSGLNAAQLAVEGSHATTLRVLLASRGFDVAWHSRDTLLLLHACAGRGFIDCLRVLLEHLSNVVLAPNQLNLKDDDGYTPLIYAISNANVDAVQCLLEHGASPDEKDFFGRSPLHFAVSVGETGSPKAVELLMTYDVDVNVKDTDGDAALHISCENDSRFECTQLLLRHGAEIGANAIGNHPTHLAARQGAVDTLKLLVEYGADMNIKNYAGKTPLGMARMLDQKSIVQFILQYFAAEPVEPSGQGVPEGEDDIADKEDDEEHLQRTQEEWDVALKSAFCMGTLAEWTHYIDAQTEISFYACPSSDGDDDGGVHCTWDSPIEFDAALGETWEVMRGGGNSMASRLRVTPTMEEEALEVSDATPGAVDVRAGAGVRYFYHNKVTGEVRTAVPPIDYSLLQDVVQNSKRHQRLRQKIRKVSAENGASAMEYMRFFHEFEVESAQTKTELLAAVKIQRHFRARRTKRMVKLLLFENKCAVHLQRAFRGRQARKLASSRRHEHVCATKIQAHWRGFSIRKRERNTFHAQRLAHRHRRLAALKIQRLFRGHCARRLAYREKVVQKLGPTGYFAWEQARRRACVKQSYKVWDELELPLEFPGVYFYCHQVTRSCSWEKPREWQAYDLEQFHERCQLFRWGYTQPIKRAAIRLQTLWRARQARIAFRLILKSVRLMKTAEREYLEDPTNFVKMGNYVLFLHSIQHDYERARPLYARLMRTMAQRGPDVPFILFSYGIYLYVTQEDDVSLVEDMILRGKLLDRQLIKYKMAFLGFFRQSLLQNPQDAESNLNYAACLQWLYDQYDESTSYYLRAIAANPHKKGTMELFQDMLNRKKQIDKAKNPARFAKPTGSKKRTKEEEQELQAPYDGFEMFRRWQVKQAEEDDLRRRKQLEAEQEAANRVAAARKIQARYRRRQAMRKVNKIKNERRMAVSMAELASTKAVYERVRMAFDQVSLKIPSLEANAKPGPKGKKAGAVAPPPKVMSVPMKHLEELFQAMNLSLSPEELQETTAEYRAQFGKTLNVSVMDVTTFSQANERIHAKMKTKTTTT